MKHVKLWTIILSIIVTGGFAGCSPRVLSERQPIPISPFDANLSRFRVQVENSADQHIDNASGNINSTTF